jgi:hypothetical protein
VIAYVIHYSKNARSSSIGGTLNDAQGYNKYSLQDIRRFFGRYRSLRMTAPRALTPTLSHKGETSFVP